MFLAERRLDGPILVVAILCTGSFADAQTTLRYQFKPGEKLSYLLETKKTNKTVIGEAPMTSESMEDLDLNWHVAAVGADGKATVRQRLARIRQQNESQGFKYAFDSQDGKIPEGLLGKKLGALHKALVGAELTMTISAQGATRDVKLSDKLRESLKEAGPAIGPGAQMMTDNQISDMLGVGVLPELPTEAVAKGQSWEGRLSNPLLGKSVPVTYTYLGPTMRVGKKVEQVSFKIGDLFAGGVPEGMKVKSQEASGVMYFDSTKGRLVEMKQSLKGETAGSAGGRNIKDDAAGTLSLTLQP